MVPCTVCVSLIFQDYLVSSCTLSLELNLSPDTSTPTFYPPRSNQDCPTGDNYSFCKMCFKKSPNSLLSSYESNFCNQSVDSPINSKIQLSAVSLEHLYFLLSHNSLHGACTVNVMNKILHTPPRRPCGLCGSSAECHKNKNHDPSAAGSAVHICMYELVCVHKIPVSIISQTLTHSGQKGFQPSAQSSPSQGYVSATLCFFQPFVQTGKAT